MDIVESQIWPVCVIINEFNLARSLDSERDVSRSLLGMWFHLLQFLARKKFSLALEENHTSPNETRFDTLSRKILNTHALSNLPLLYKVQY